MNAHTKINQMYLSVKADERVTALDMPTHLAAARDAHGDLLELHSNQIDKWTRENWSEKKAGAERAMAHFDETFQEILSLKATALDFICAQHKSKFQSVQRRSRDLVKKIQDLLQSGKVPSVLAGFLARALERRDPDSRFLSFHCDTRGSSDGMYPYELHDMLADYRNVWALLVENQSDIALHWQNVTKVAINGCGPSLDEKIGEAMDHMQKHKKAHVLIAPMPSAELKVNPSGATIFDQVATMPPGLYVHRAFHLEVGEAMPLTTVSSWYVVVSGFYLFTIVKLEHAMNCEKNLGSLMQFIEDLTPSMVANLPMFGVACGGAVWVPHGHILLPIAIDKGLDSKKCSSQPFGALIQIPCLITPLLKSLTAAVLSEMKTFLESSIRRKVKLLKGDGGSKLTAWIEQWPEIGGLSPHQCPKDKVA
jgi:hypothetical protein